LLTLLTAVDCCAYDGGSKAGMVRFVVLPTVQPMTNNRNADLFPAIMNAIAHNKAGNKEQRDIQICNINHQLMERGEEPDVFWQSFVEAMQSLG